MEIGRGSAQSCTCGDVEFRRLRLGVCGERAVRKGRNRNTPAGTTYRWRRKIGNCRGHPPAFGAPRYALPVLFRG